MGPPSGVCSQPASTGRRLRMEVTHCTVYVQNLPNHKSKTSNAQAVVSHFKLKPRAKLKDVHMNRKIPTFNKVKFMFPGIQLKITRHARKEVGKHSNKESFETNIELAQMLELLGRIIKQAVQLYSFVFKKERLLSGLGRRPCEEGWCCGRWSGVLGAGAFMGLCMRSIPHRKNIFRIFDAFVFLSKQY